MGKRELLLIVGFVVVGTLVYLATAPERESGDSGFSFGGLIEEIRREARGRPASAEVTTTGTFPVGAAITELRLNPTSTHITIIGEKRDDIVSELHVVSNGYDEQEAKSLAGQVALILEPAGPSMMGKLTYPQPGTQRGRLTLKVPARLVVLLEQTGGRLEISGVSAVEHKLARGETAFRRIAGRVTATHRGGTLTIEDAGSIRINTRGSEVQIARVHGEAILHSTAGEVHASELAGSIEVQGEDAEITLEKLQKTRGSVRINSVEGELVVHGLSTEARIDGRDTEMNISMDKAAPVAIFNTDRNGSVEITPPPGGYTFDAVAADARILAPEELRSQITSSASGDKREDRLSTKVGGDGPTITIRTTRGEIRITPRGMTTNQG